MVLKNSNIKNEVVNNNVNIFAPTEPDKPLNNAQMVGSSIQKYFYKDNTPPLPLNEAHLGGFLFYNFRSKRKP